MAVFVGVLILLGTLGAYAGTRGVPAMTVPAPPGGLLAQLSAAARVADFRRLLITFGVQALAIGCLLAGVDYVARVVLDRPGAVVGAVRLLRRSGPAGHPDVAAARRPARQEAGYLSRVAGAGRRLRRAAAGRLGPRSPVVYGWPR